MDDWNNHGISVFDEDEAPRSSNSNFDKSKDENSKPVTTSQASAADQEEFLKSITGIFDIISEAVEGGWHSKSQGLTIGFHVDEHQKKIWGSFDVGIVDGYLLSLPPDRLSFDIPIEFQWRGRESETGSHMSGSGKVTLQKDETVQGVFHGMAGDVDFQGKRKLIHDTNYYRQGWEDYAHDGDSQFY